MLLSSRDEVLLLCGATHEGVRTYSNAAIAVNLLSGSVACLAPAGDLPRPRNGACAVALPDGRRVLLMGGGDDAHTFFDAFVFDREFQARHIASVWLLSNLDALKAATEVKHRLISPRI